MGGVATDGVLSGLPVGLTDGVFGEVTGGGVGAAVGEGGGGKGVGGTGVATTGSGVACRTPEPASNASSCCFEMHVCAPESSDTQSCFVLTLVAAFCACRSTFLLSSWTPEMMSGVIRP